MIAARNPDVGHGFREELRHAVDAVGENPGTWPRHGGRARRYVFPRFPFSLVYVLRDEEVEVVADPATGARDSDRLSNIRIQRSALRAAADPARSPNRRRVCGGPNGGRAGSLSTLLCGDLFTQGGADLPPITESDILGPSEAFRHEMDYFSHTKNARVLLEKLASTRPATLACMHGSVWRGDGAKLLRALADALSA